MAIKTVMMEVGGDKVAIMTINNPPVNSLSNAVHNGLYKCFKEAQERNDIKAIVITGADGKFCGGADIRNFQKKQNAEDESEKSIIAPRNLFNNVIEACEKPVVAAIEGFALGGGLELAMVCHARVASEGTELGLPELQLGIIPGLGGTQRLPRLIGLDKALDMLLTSRSISAETGREYGLVDVVTHSSDVLETSRRQALAMVHPRKSWLIALHRMDKVGNSDNFLKTLTNARAKAKRKFRNVRYPFVCLDVVEEGLCKGGEIGTELETKACRALVNTFEARALMHIFFSQRSTSKVFYASTPGLKARAVKNVAVVGCGLMGSGIAATLVAHNIPVLVKDISSTVLENGLKMIKENLEGLVKKGKMTELQARDALALVKTTESYKGFESLDLVVESVHEDLPLKQRIFHELESVCSINCILASNTSALKIAAIGAKLSFQDRMAGTHFFSPPHVMQLLEIVHADQTSAQTVMDLLSLAKTLNKVPLIVKDVPGFAANRLFVPYLMFSTFLVDLGLDPYHIDAVIKDFGMPMGPFRFYRHQDFPTCVTNVFGEFA
ncbi:hypothetical protein GOP47_0016175 [Adiantum capillus-veneris]|uniref:3-hydroxyacyl-CoA dehydrogenase n=1 Tax=Adiantum capillus-veneris TaxID=13818 RepID=A0A9D4UL25_ADICA|nr:hypothetical protein GOP47_0016175 [Adiantum capillus-veneris]